MWNPIGRASDGTVSATSDPSYGNTRLNNWGLGNQDNGGGTIYIEPGPGKNLVLTDSWQGTGIVDSTINIYAPDVYLRGAGRWASTSIPGYEIPSAANCGSGHFETYAYCSSGKKVLGGGCYDSAASERALVRNNPISDYAWQCRSRDINVGQYTCLYAYVICATR